MELIKYKYKIEDIVFKYETIETDLNFLAEEIAEDYFDNHDGWEDKWPIDIEIYKNNELIWSGKVGIETKPVFIIQERNN